MDRDLRVFDRFEEAELADLEEWMALSGDERVRIGESMRAECFVDGALPLARVLSVRDPDADEE
jgi:hypothetical protein